MGYVTGGRSYKETLADGASVSKTIYDHGEMESPSFFVKAFEAGTYTIVVYISGEALSTINRVPADWAAGRNLDHVVLPGGVYPPFDGTNGIALTVEVTNNSGGPRVYDINMAWKSPRGGQ